MSVCLLHIIRFCCVTIKPVLLFDGMCALCACSTSPSEALTVHLSGLVTFTASHFEWKPSCGEWNWALRQTLPVSVSWGSFNTIFRLCVCPNISRKFATKCNGIKNRRCRLAFDVVRNLCFFFCYPLIIQPVLSWSLFRNVFFQCIKRIFDFRVWASSHNKLSFSGYLSFSHIQWIASKST